VNITTTTFTGNSAIGGLGTLEGLPGGNAYGGAVYVAAGQVILSNATVNNNFAYTPYGPPATGYGAGLYIAGGTVTLTNDTVESNTVRFSYYNEPIYQNGGYGGGLFIAKGATVYLDSFTVANTINNTDSTGNNGSTANIDGTYTLT